MENNETNQTRKKFVNLSNHLSDRWTEEQMKAASEYGEVVDMQFPNIEPAASSEEVALLAAQYVDKIKSIGVPQDTTVHVMGEFVFSFKVITLLKTIGYSCVASTSERIVTESSDHRISIYKFVRFREY